MRASRLLARVVFALVFNPAFISAYDAVGNRMSITCTDQTYNAINQLIRDCEYTYGYDANGNMIDQTEIATGQKTSHVYDSQNRRIRTEFPDGSRTQYQYDGLGRKIYNITTLPNGLEVKHGYIYDGDHILAIIDLKDNSLVVMYTYGPGMDEPIAMTDAEGKTTQFHADGLNSIVAQTDENAKVTERIEYQAYGMPYFTDLRDAAPVVSNANSSNNIFSYAGRIWEPISQTYDYRFRDYDPRTGRFHETDPIQFNSGDTTIYSYVDAVGKPLFSPNSYVYADNNPVIYVDPYGLYSERPFAFFYDADNFFQATSNFSAGFDEFYTFGIGRYFRNQLRIGGITECSAAYGVGRWTGIGAGIAARTLFSARLGAEIAIAGRGTFLGRWLSQGRYWRVGASGAEGIPTLRIGVARPITWFNHIDLRFLGY
jgi:RHS repeat-associated protein